MKESKGVSILEVPLGRPLAMTERRHRKLLAEMRRECCLARNAAVLHWYVWRREHPDWKPGGAYDPPAAKIQRKPKPDAKPAKDSPVGPRLFLSRELYAVACEAAPRLAASIVSGCVQDVLQWLKARMPYNHDGGAQYRWQAVLAHEINLPTWRCGQIPVPARASSLGYLGRSSRPMRSVDAVCNDHAALAAPLLSKASGYRELSPAVLVEVKDLSAGRKRILRRLAAGELKLCDFSLYERKPGKWVAQLVYPVERTACGLPADRVMELRPGLPGDRFPFTLSWTGEDGQSRRWGVGLGKPLVAEYRRVVARRRAIRAKQAGGKGHGKGRFYRSIRPLARAVKDQQDRFVKMLAEDVLKAAVREGCGLVVYREPSLPIRERSWFAAADVPFDWTALGAYLAHKLRVRGGLEFDVQRIRMAEWKPKDKASDAA